MSRTMDDEASAYMASERKRADKAEGFYCLPEVIAFQCECGECADCWEESAEAFWTEWDLTHPRDLARVLRIGTTPALQVDY
jgi:hypothetical protein